MFVFLLEGGVCIKRLEDEPCPKAGGWYLTLLKSCWRSSVIVISLRWEDIVEGVGLKTFSPFVPSSFLGIGDRLNEAVSEYSFC